MRIPALLAIIICFSACVPMLVPFTFSAYQTGRAMTEGAAALPYLARSTVGLNDPAFYSPYQKDAAERTLDSVIDWAVLTTDCYKKQIHQAILVTMEANKIIENQAKPGFWEAKEKWLAGGYMEVFENQDRQTCAVLGIEPERVKPPK